MAKESGGLRQPERAFGVRESRAARGVVARSNREANMVHTAQTTRRTLRIEARAVASSSFTAAGLSYLALAIGVLSLGILAAFL